MGYIKHNAVIAVTIEGYEPDVEQFRSGLPEEWRPLVVGPIPGVVNGYVSYAFLPDGSKEGWPLSADGDKYRADFMALFDIDAIDVGFGGDDDLTHVTTTEEGE